MPNNTSYDIPTVRKTIKVIELLCQSLHPLGVSEISRAIGINKNMAFRLLSTLHNEGWVAIENPGPKYRMTLRPFQITSQPLGRLTLKAVSAGPLRELWKEIGETVYVSILYNDKVLHIEHLEGVRSSIRIAGQIGGQYPLHCGAPGKVLLAHAGDKVFARLSAKGFKRYTENTICEPHELHKHLAKVRLQGWARDNEELHRGMLCFAAPIKDHTGNVVGAIGTTVITFSYSAEDVMRVLAPRIIKKGHEISMQLGCQVPHDLKKMQPFAHKAARRK